ncbi:hypothetical protein OOU_Y34scaffold00526g12 [Pyricularia oryzae Y34]|uniref:Uncharacterized protein n=2 Tax=Pyricularia oryzae TaxID=318829 RepID=A0AA97NYP2_PYRO3|nr:hypothetical protein OOU_Y34scaffold00526g12 [Pyricularia oryzae Y34]
MIAAADRQNGYEPVACALALRTFKIDELVTLGTELDASP